MLHKSKNFNIRQTDRRYFTEENGDLITNLEQMNTLCNLLKEEINHFSQDTD